MTQRGTTVVQTDGVARAWPSTRTITDHATEYEVCMTPPALFAFSTSPHLLRLTMAADDTKHNVVVSPLALTTMLLHAAKHGTSSVHGILVGSFGGGSVRVTSAVPVCHEAPTKPLVDTSLSLVEGIVVGWYTSPELFQEERPGAPALRIAASLAASSADGEPILIVLQNQAVAECLQGDSKMDVIRAYGKDFGQQWKEPLEVSLESKTKALEAARQAHEDNVTLNDLVDSWDSATDWYPSTQVVKCIEKVL